jgi:O-antigen ligase
VATSPIPRHMPSAATTHDRPSLPPLLIRVLVAFGIPLLALMAIAGTYLGKDLIVGIGWIAFSMVGFFVVRPGRAVAVMTGAFLMAAYPTMLQSLGFLTVNNLLGVLLVALMGVYLLETRDFGFLRNKQVRILALIGVLFWLGFMHADATFLLLKKTMGKAHVLNKSDNMTHDFIARLVYLIFYIVFVRERRDIKLLFIVFMCTLYLAVPSALLNMWNGTLNRDFRLEASLTAGSNPNRLALICLMEVACLWFWARSRPGVLRQLVALGFMSGAVVVTFGTGSRSGLLGVGILVLLLQTSTKQFRVPTVQLVSLAGAAVLAVMVIVPAGSFERMITFEAEHGVAASSNRMREETVYRAIDMFEDHPVWGVGLGNFREVSRQYYFDPYYRPPHNSYLWAAAEGGGFVLGTYLVLFWVTWKDLRQVTRLAHRDPEIGATAGAIRALFLLYAFFSVFADLWVNPITYAMIGQIIVMRRYLESLPEPAPVVRVAVPAGRRVAWRPAAA